MSITDSFLRDADRHLTRMADLVEGRKLGAMAAALAGLGLLIGGPTPGSAKPGQQTAVAGAPPSRRDMAKWLRKAARTRVKKNPAVNFLLQKLQQAQQSAGNKGSDSAQDWQL